MNSKIKVVNKGYTITVDSWENDMDNGATNSMTVDTLEQVKVLCEMMKLCESNTNQPPGVIKLGNTYDKISDEQVELIVNFIKQNILTLAPHYSNTEEYLPTQDWTDQDCIATFKEYSDDLLNGGEYMFRVCWSYKVTYSPKDIYVEEINI